MKVAGVRFSRQLLRPASRSELESPTAPRAGAHAAYTDESKRSAAERAAGDAACSCELTQGSPNERSTLPSANSNQHTIATGTYTCIVARTPYFGC